MRSLPVPSATPVASPHRPVRWGPGVLALAVVLATGCAPDEPPEAPTETSAPAPAPHTPTDTGDTPDTTPTDTGDTVLGPNAVVERIVDGDTIIVEVAGRRERVRLIGIDTPESVDENRPVQCYGHEASAHLAELLPPGTPVTLVLDDEPRDRYDRLLAYVIRSDDQLFVNLHMLEEGYAGPLTIAPNDHYANRFEAAAAEARADGRGLWGACGGPDVPLG